MYDVLLTPTGDLPHFWARSSDRALNIKQKCEIRLRTHLGEWLLDLDAGFPYAETPSFDVLAALVERDLLEVEGVLSVTVTRLDASTRTEYNMVVSIKTDAAIFEIEV